MSEKELRRSMAVLPIGTVMKLTSLTARQIRYYEENELVFPDRSEGNRRLFSLNDIDRLLEIKDFIAEGLNIADIKQRFEQRRTETLHFGYSNAENLKRRITSNWKAIG